ncbi:hypothetical protein ACFLXH_05380, partial [Chloroflexota bacterium]
PPEEEVVLEQEPAPEPATLPEIDASAEVIELNVQDLSALYQNDKAGTGTKLTNKTVRVTGIVERAVANSGLDIYYVLLTSSGSKSWNVRCTFNAGNSSDLRGLVRGRPATIQGQYAGYERNILLKECFLVR